MIIFYDLETTGLNQYHDKITEICMIKFNYFTNQTETFNTLINPEKKIPQIVTNITGIDQSMVQDKPTFEQIAEQIVYFINGNLQEKEKVYLIAHNNLGYDQLVLSSHFKRMGFNMAEFNWVFLDTLLIGKKLYPQFKKYNLKALCQELGVQTLEAHRAEADTTMLKNLFLRQLQDLQYALEKPIEKIIHDLDIIRDYCL